jgi:pre-mRNA-processing factor 6
VRALEVARASDDVVRRQFDEKASSLVSVPSRKSAFDAPQRLLFAPPTAAMAGKAPSFQGMKPPPGYVAGLGRGATGFTTRSDIGPGAPAPPMGAQATLGDAASGSRAAMARGFGRGRGAPGASAPPVDDEPDQQPAQFDAFQGGDAGIFAARKGEYDDDDREADEIWASVDDHMDSRRRDQREARLKAELEKYRKENPKITEQFADAKRKLQEVSYEEWDAIPDIGDYSIKKKKGGREFAPAPDTLLQKAMAERETSAYDDGANGSMSDATAGNSSSGGVRNDLTAVGEGRSSVLGLKLDAMGDSVAGQTVVDPKGYLTSLSSVKVSSTSEISDVKKARLLLKSVISTNPKHAPGWIAAARLEELAGKISAARSFAQRGCDACPTSADAWLENARLNPPDVARAVLARAVVALPDDVELWIHAAQLEDDAVRKRRVLRKALERVPNSVRLWKAVVDLSEEDDAKILLARAVECCPQHVDLWLALARLETRENARVVLNKARETLPAEPQIWIAAAELEEAHLDPPLATATEGTDLAGADILASSMERSNIVRKIIERAIKSLRNKGVSVDREYWLKEAETAEKAGSPLTCRAIVFATAGAGVDELDRKRTWKADAAEALARGSVETARSIYEVAVETFPGKKSLWVLYAKLEGDSGHYKKWTRY